MRNRKLNTELRVLLSLYKAKGGLTVPMVSRIKDITSDYAYQVLMRLTRQKYTTRCLSAIRGKYKSYRFFISEAGIAKLQDAGLAHPDKERR